MVRDKENTLSSFFMLLLASTGLIVILSLFFSSGFRYRTHASAQTTPVMVEEETADYDDAIEPSE